MGRREENKRIKREGLLRVGREQLLEHGYDRASIEQIAAGAGVARGTFYLYFPDKAALFATIVDAWSTPTRALLASVHTALGAATTRAEARRIYEGMALGLATLGVQHRDALLIAFREGRQPGEGGALVRERDLAIQDKVTALTALAAERGLIEVEDPRVASLVVLGAVERLSFEVLVGRDLGVDPPTLAARAMALFARALGLPA